MRRFSVSAFIVLAAPLAQPQQPPFVFHPTTTLAAESANNTSASSSFRAQSNGNTAPRNVSKLPIVSLLYPDATTKIYAQFQAWFGDRVHMDVGYRSDTSEQVRKQIDDMRSRGITGVIIDWYGSQHTRDDRTSMFIMREAERRGDFQFAIQEDKGAFKSCGEKPGCDVSQKVIDDVNYILDTYARSPAYIRVDGRPVVPFFDPDRYHPDWNRVRRGIRGNPLFLFRDTHGFAHPQSDGAYSWRGIATSREDAGLGDLDRFYSAARANAGLLSWGAAYKGFDDSLAAWGKAKYVAQHCGETWLATLRATSRFYSTDRQLPALQIVTWNDYEEGTEIETGIDNCVTVQAAVSGSRLTWTITGNDDTLDHFTIFLSKDGNDLMALADVRATARSFDLPTLPAGDWRLRVKAVGRPSLTNALSGEAHYRAP